MKSRHLGSTGIEISPIGLGVMQFSGGKGVYGLIFPDLSQEEKTAIVAAALEGGINWFDTAELYGFGKSERSLASALIALNKSNDDIVIATKWLPLLRTAGSISRSIEKRLEFLNGYHIDLYMVHQPWGLSSPEAEMNAMADLVEASQIRSVGVSNFSAERMRRAHEALHRRGLALTANQVKYSLLDRRIETNGVLDTAKELGVTIIAYTPLESGLLTGKYHKNPRLLERKSIFQRKRFSNRIDKTRPLVALLGEVAQRYNATPAQVALNWVINNQGDIVVAIPGATRVEQVVENAGAMMFKLSEKEIAQLGELVLFSG